MKNSAGLNELNFLLEKYSSTRFMKKGTVLLYQSEVPRHAFIITSGLVRAYTITNTGEERTIALHGPGDMVPLSWIFSESATTLFYYDTLLDSELITVPKDVLVKTITEHPVIMSELLQLTINEYTSLLLRITALEQASAAEKIALTFYYLLFRHGSLITPGVYVINIKLTQSMLASLVGLTRESTAVNLKVLKKKGIVTYSNFTYTVYKENIERFVGEDSFKNALPTSEA